MSGEGYTQGAEDGPKIVFTQTLCSPYSLFAPVCPSVAWKAQVFRNGVSDGSLTGESLYPGGTTRQAQLAQARLSALNEPGLTDERVFSLDLKPQ